MTVRPRVPPSRNVRSGQFCQFTLFIVFSFTGEHSFGSFLQISIRNKVSQSFILSLPCVTYVGPVQRHMRFGENVWWTIIDVSNPLWKYENASIQLNAIFLTLLYTSLLLNLCLPCFKHMIDTCMIKKGNVIYKTHFFQLACLWGWVKIAF